MNVIKAIGEYVTMVKNGVKNGDKIIEAIRISAKIKEQEKLKLAGDNSESEISDEAVAEIMRRKEICAGCPFNSKNAAVQRNYSSDLPFQHCTLCKCRIGTDDSKEYCLSCNCGMEVWNNKNKHLSPMQLKWTAFPKNNNKN